MAAELSQTPCEMSRKIVKQIFQRLSSVGQTKLAEDAKVSEATVSRWKSEQVEPSAKFMALLGLKVVPAAMQCYTPEYISSLRFFANIGMSVGEQPQTLEQDFE